MTQIGILSVDRGLLFLNFVSGTLRALNANEGSRDCSDEGDYVVLEPLRFVSSAVDHAGLLLRVPEPHSTPVAHLVG